MRTLIVYDSAFGNTKKIAEAIFDVIDKNKDSKLYYVKDLETIENGSYDLVIIGSPTQGFRPTKDTIAFLKNIPDRSLNNTRVAAFDTRIHLDQVNSKALRFMVDKGGYAAKPILKQLIKKGGESIAEPEGFYVEGEKGPLRENEIERAKEWAKSLVRIYDRTPM